jgi:cyclin-dependent kinase 8/11
MSVVDVKTATSSSVFHGLQGNQLPPVRRITHDEASAAMLSTATNARAPAGPAAPGPAPGTSSVRPPSGVPSFASGLGGQAGTTGAGAYAGPGMTRVPIVGGGSGGSECVAGNTRKKARMG